MTSRRESHPYCLVVPVSMCFLLGADRRTPCYTGAVLDNSGPVLTLPGSVYSTPGVRPEWSGGFRSASMEPPSVVTTTVAGATTRPSGPTATEFDDSGCRRTLNDHLSGHPGLPLGARPAQQGGPRPPPTTKQAATTTPAQLPLPLQRRRPHFQRRPPRLPRAHDDHVVDRGATDGVGFHRAAQRPHGVRPARAASGPVDLLRRPDVTVLAPINQSIDDLRANPGGQDLLGDPQRLRTLVQRHVVIGRYGGGEISTPGSTHCPVADNSTLLDQRRHVRSVAHRSSDRTSSPPVEGSST